MRHAARELIRRENDVQAVSVTLFKRTIGVNVQPVMRRAGMRNRNAGNVLVQAGYSVAPDEMPLLISIAKLKKVSQNCHPGERRDLAFREAIGLNFFMRTQ